MSIVLLDIGNVLVDVDFMIFCGKITSSGEVGAEAIYGRYCVSELKNRFDKGSIAPSSYLETIAGDPDTRSVCMNELKTAWQDIFVKKTDVPDSVGEILQNHRIWIMSDTDPLHFTHLLNILPVLRTAERYWLSFERGYLKREPEAFQELISVSGRDAGEFVLIDDREDNCRTAAAAGIRAIRFRNWSQALQEMRTV